MITVLGVGPSPLAERDRARLGAAALILGTPRHLAGVGLVPDGPPGRPAGRPGRSPARVLALGGDLEPALAAIEACAGPVVVLASGDPGFFGIVRALAQRFGRHRLEVVPGVSSVAVAFARAGLPWDDAVVVSAHGRDPRAAVNACLAHPKVAVLTDPGFGPAELAVALAGSGRRMLVAERLGEPDERVVEGSTDQIAAGRWHDPNVVVVFDDARAVGGRRHTWPPVRPPTVPGPPQLPDRSQGSATAPPGSAAPAGAASGGTDPPRGRRWLGWALPEAAFEHRPAGRDAAPRPWAGMVTKVEVRALALARLAPGIGELVWDVGAGSGSVGIECARLGAAVIAIDRDIEACRLVAGNAARHQVDLRVVHGAAPAALAALPDPDAAFVGGSGGALDAVCGAVAGRVRRACVVALAGVERVVPAAELLAAGGLEVETTLVQAARLEGLAGLHRLLPTNPVFLVSGVRP